MSDTTPPNIISVEFSDKIVSIGYMVSDLSDLPITLELSDDLSGISRYIISWLNPSESQFVTSWILPTNLGLYALTQPNHGGGLTQWSELGEYTFHSLYLEDNAGNYIGIRANDLPSYGLIAEQFNFTVVGSYDYIESDTTPPNIISVEFSDKIVNIGETGYDLSDLPITLELSDDLSGVQFFNLSWDNPSKSQLVSTSSNGSYLEDTHVLTQPSEGDVLNGQSELGEYTFNSMMLLDLAGNYAHIPGIYLPNYGLTAEQFNFTVVVGVQSTPEIPIITGTIGDDSLIVNSGTTSVQAGSGTDTTVFSGNYADYTFSQSDSYVSLMTHNATGQVVSLFGVEQLQFDDGLFGLSTTGSGEFQVNTYITSNQYYPSITTLNNGGFVVSWQSNEQDGNHYGVFAQMYDASGDTVGSEFQVNTTTTSFQGYSSITNLNDDGFVISWQSSNDIYAQMYDASGDAVGSELQVNSGSKPSIAALSDWGFVITWSSGNNIYAQMYNTSGNRVGSEIQVNTYTTNDQDEPSITTLSNGGFVIAWTSNGQDGDYLGIYAQIYDTSGNRVGGEFQVNTYTTIMQQYPSIAALNDDGFIVTWSSFQQDLSGYGIYAQMYDASGDTVGSEFQVNTYTTSNQSHSSIAKLNNTGFVISWTSIQDGDGDGIYAQMYDASGDTVGSEFQVNTYTTSNQWSSSIAELNNGSYLVVWASDDQDGDSYGIYAQRYDSESNPLDSASLNPIPSLSSNIIDQTSDEDSPYNYDTSANFSSVDTLTYSAALSNGSALPSWLSFNTTTGVLSGTPINGDEGAIDITITATDTSGDTVSDTYTLSVNNTNDAPYLQVNSKTIGSYGTNGDMSFNPGWSVSQTFIAEEGWSISEVVISFLNTSGFGELKISIIEGSPEAPGDLIYENSYDVGQGIQYVNQNVAAASLHSGNVLKFDTSDSPVLANTDVYHFKLTNLSSESYGLDFQGGSLVTDFQDGDFWLNHSGFEIKMSDYYDLSFELRILSGIDNTSINEYTSYSYDVSTYFNDVDIDDILTYSATLSDGGNLPSWLSISNTTGILSGTPANGNDGAIDITVTVTDTSNASISDTYTLSVNNSTDALISSTSGLSLNNLTLHYYKDGLDTGVSTLIEQGGIEVSTDVVFDYVVLEPNNTYSDNLNILDLYGVLNNIGQDVNTLSKHAADMNNNGVINILDLYDVLNNIGQEPQSFDLIDANGTLITSLDTDSTSTPNWTIVANGDVDMSGAFDDAYVMQADIT